MFQGSFSLVLRAGALCWLISLGMTSAVMYMLSDEFGTSPWLWKMALCMALGIGVLLLLASLVCKSAPSSALWRMTFAGALVLVPVLTLSGSVGLSYLAAAPEGSRVWLLMLVVFTAAIWCSMSLSVYKQRVVQRRFIEREFLIEKTRILVRQPIETDLSSPPISEHTILGKIYHRAGPYLIMLVPMAYPIQRLLSDTAGFAAVLLLLSILCIPLTIYFLGRMTCAVYLWIFKVWQLEKQHGKPVVFEVIPTQ